MLRIENAIDERIGEFILSARNVPDIDAFEIAQQLQRSAVQRLKRRVLHAVFPEQLFDHEFGIEPHRQLSHPKAHRGFEPGEETVPLGNVVGCMSEIARRLLDHRTAIVDEHRCTGRGAGVTASASIGEEGNVTGSPSVHNASISRIVMDFRLECQEHTPVRSKSTGIMGGRTLDRTLLLHVGTHKTGTTALQEMLIHNRDGFAAHGITIPETGRVYHTPEIYSPGHHGIAWDIASANPAGLLAQLIDELHAGGARTAIISSEEFHPLHHRSEAFPALRAALESAGFRTIVVLYLRAQARYAESLFQQHLRDRRNPSFAEHIAELLDRGRMEIEDLRFEFFYSTLLDSLARSFGPENIVVRPYLPDRGPEYIHQDFLRIIAAVHGPFSFPLAAAIANERFTLRALLQALYRNLHDGAFLADEQLDTFVRTLQPQFDPQLLDHRFLLLSYAESVRFLQRFAADNSLVQARAGARIPFQSLADIPPAEHSIWLESSMQRRLFQQLREAWS